jgi:hypothetical protein
MMRSRLQAIGGFFLAALLSSPVWGSIPPQPGTINYIEGQAAIGAQVLSQNSVRSVNLATGQTLSTQNGRAEILMTPGIFVRVGDHSSLEMVSPGLADTLTTLHKGRAMVEVANIQRANNVRITEDTASAQLQKVGLYDFDADRGVIRVFDGEALVQKDGQSIEVTSGHEINLNDAGKLKARKFDKNQYVADDFYRWSSLRSSYLADANVDAARTYAGGPGSSPGLWNGAGWYWDPWFTAYTFIPGDGIFYDPFGWGFYSPWYAPFGFGYGFGYVGNYYRHFGPGYQTRALVTRAPGFAGHAYSVRGGTIGGLSRSGFVGGGGGFRGGAGSFRGGGGGFHGGGGGRGR